MPAKVCPRCGAQYANLRSATCPQCFAKLVEVDEATAEELAAARAAVESTPEFQQAKAEEDERFREQSFSACLGVLGIMLLTAIVVIGILVIGIRRNSHPSSQPAAGPRAAAASTDVPTLLPRAGAAIDEVLPPQIGPYRRRMRDQDVTLPGTLTPINHAVYARSGPDRSALDVYAIPTGRPTSEQNEFRLGVTLAAQMGGSGARPLLIFATEHWRYAVIGPPGMPGPVSADDFERALAARFRGGEGRARGV